MEDFIEDENKEVSFDFKQYLLKLAAYYRWIILALVSALLCGYLYLRYEVSQYQIDGYILVGGGELEGGTNAILNNAGLISTTDAALNTVNNEIFILRSYKLIGDVVDSLKLNIEVSENGRFKNQPVYADSLPVMINVRKPEKYINKSSIPLLLSIRNENFTIQYGDKHLRGKYNQAFVIDNDTILISRKNNEFIRPKKLALNIKGRLQTIKKYRGRLTVTQAKSAGVGLLQISIIDELPVRGNQIIAALIEAYNISYLNYKNQAIHRALKFLDQRLASVSSDLDKQENMVRDFRANNKVYDVPTIATDMLGKIQGADLQKSQNTYQLDLLNLIERSIKNVKGKEEIVANAGNLTDNVLSTQVAAYNGLVQQKQSIIATNNERDARIPAIDDQLAGLRANILTNIANIRSQIKTSNDFLSRQNNAFSAKFSTLPEKDKQYIEINRKLGVQEALYTFILQKKEETELQLVSEDVVRSRTVDVILNQGLVSPRRMIIYGISAAIGLVIPLLVIFLIVFLNKKIESRKEIEDGTNTPILGELSMSQLSAQPIAITSTNRSAIAEQFRAIRTNLSYISVGQTQKVFIVTSSISGEGKSFVSLNLANSMAIIDKRVVVLELDLRKPALSNKFGLTGRMGISEYLVNDSISPKDIVSPLDGYPNLFLVSSGPIPPNPGELITSPRMAKLIEYLKENFDYVIMDTPPVGLVADSITLGQLADTSIFVIRHKYSFKSSLSLINDLKVNERLPHLSLVINGIEDSKSYGYGYGYGYGGYGYGYYSEDAENKSPVFMEKFKTMFKRKN